MKRIFIVLLMALLLSGCTPESPPKETTESTGGQIEETVQLYAPNSNIEKQTDGAVKQYALGETTYSDICFMGDNLLLISPEKMLVLSGEQGQVVAELPLEGASVSAVDTAITGMAYYDEESKTVQVFNPHLQGVTQLRLPENMVGTPVICLAKNEVYLSVGNEIRAINITTGLSRLVRRQNAGSQSLLGIYFDGTVLLWQYTDEAGKTHTEYISAETGQTLAGGADILYMNTNGQRYYALFRDGDEEKAAVGTRGGETARFLAPMPENGGRVPVLAMNGVVNYKQTKSGLALSFYDLSTGKRTARVELPGVGMPAAIGCDGKAIWILEENLYRWDITKSRSEGKETYIGPLYTAANPDTAGLAKCRELADTYEQQYGVKLLLWQDAVAQTGDYEAVGEHEPQVLTKMLEALEPALTQFPDRFLLKTVERGWVRIALVRSIEGDRDWAHFWAEGDCWILISAKADAELAFYQGVAYAIDSHVLGNSRDFDSDRWNPLNPKGFDYAYSYDVEDNQKYLEGKNRAFTDLLAMSYPHEDRSRVFYNAVLPDNQDMFQSSVMQAKLKQLCMGIREAYNLDKSTETYLWEQYLKESMAYEKK